MSSYSRHHHHRASLHAASSYSPSLGLSGSSSSSSYGRYASSDYASKYSSGGYRRHSTTTAGSDYVSRYGGSSAGGSSGSSSSSRLGTTSSSTTSGIGSSSLTSSYRAGLSNIPAYSKRFETNEEYDKHRRSDYARRTSVDASASSSRRTSVDNASEAEDFRTFRTRRSSAASQSQSHDVDGRGSATSAATVVEEKSRNLSTSTTASRDLDDDAEPKEARRGRDSRSYSLRDDSSSAARLPPSGKGKCGGVENRSSSSRVDGDQVFEDCSAAGGGVDPSRSRSAANKGTSSFPGLKSGHPPDVVSTSARGSRAQEVARLESLCETRTKELCQARMRLKDSLQAFDAMACLLNYCTTQLDAFSCPSISAKLKKTTDKLAEQQQSLELAAQEKRRAEQELQEVQEARNSALQEAARLKEEARQAEEAHAASVRQLQEQQSSALQALREEVTSQHKDTLQQMQKYQENQTEHTRQYHNRQLVELTSEHQMATNQLKVQHLEDIQALRNKHELQVEELHVQHRKKLEDITDRFESIKLSLTEKVQSLCTECDDLRLRAKSSEEALQRDADVKVQLALTPYLHLPKEIESLKTVIDMRTEEIQKLRRQNMDLVKQLEELPIVQEKVVSLQQKVENLQAIINIKTDHEKQLHEKCQVLMRKYDRESRANKRLSMDYEQVVWRMSQSADFTGSMESLSPRGGPLSRSPSRGGSAQPGHSHGSSPVRSLSTSSQGAVDGSGGSNGVLNIARRQRKTSGGDEQDQRRRANTFSDTPRHRRGRPDVGGSEEGGSGVNNGPSSSCKRRGLSKSGDYSGMVSSAGGVPTTTTTTPAASTALVTTTKDLQDHEESFSSSGHESGDTSDFFSSLESNVILETAQGVSFSLVDRPGAVGAMGVGSARDGSPAPHDDVFMEEVVMLHPIQDVSPEETATTTTTTTITSCTLPPPPESGGGSATADDQSTTEVVTVVVTSPSSM